MVLLVIVLLAALAKVASGTVIVSQSPEPGGGTSRWSQLWQDPTPAGNNLDGDSVCWEDFTLAQSMTIDHLQWWGTGASELGFQIEFWRQDPGTIAYQPLGVFYYGVEGNPTVHPEPPGFITVVPAESPDSGVIHYAADLPTPVTLAANSSGNPRWFVGVVGLTHQAYYTWNWAQGTGGSTRTFQFIRGGTTGGGPLFRRLSEGRALAVSGTALKGDFNRDGLTDVADIQSMMTALADSSGYASTYSLNIDQMSALGDFSGDGAVDNSDLQGLINLLAGGAAVAAVPEPATISLLLSLTVTVASALCVRRFCQHKPRGLRKD